jgi:hypothetical protein
MWTCEWKERECIGGGKKQIWVTLAKSGSDARARSRNRVPAGIPEKEFVHSCCEGNSEIRSFLLVMFASAVGIQAHWDSDFARIISGMKNSCFECCSR